MSERHTPPEDVTVTSRGFWHWPEIRPECDPHNLVRFYESSAAGVYGTTMSGKDFEVHGSFAWLYISGGPAHLTHAEVAQLRDQMNAWLSAHTDEDGNPV